MPFIKTGRTGSTYNKWGTTEHIFKWFMSLSSLLEGHTVGEQFHLALQALRGTDKVLW
jgi:hypothetical protein